MTRKKPEPHEKPGRTPADPGNPISGRSATTKLGPRLEARFEAVRVRLNMKRATAMRDAVREWTEKREEPADGR